jgi:hypothetical protein
MLSLFRAKTEEELNELEGLGVSVVTQAIEAYRTVTASNEFKELERLRLFASHNEASALECARLKEREKLQGALDKKDAALADKDAEIMRLRALLGKSER